MEWRQFVKEKFSSLSLSKKIVLHQITGLLSLTSILANLNTKKLLRPPLLNENQKCSPENFRPLLLVRKAPREVRVFPAGEMMCYTHD